MRSNSSPCPPACSLSRCSKGRTASLPRHIPFSAIRAFSRTFACACALQRGQSAVAIMSDCKIVTPGSQMVSSTSSSEKQSQAAATACFHSEAGFTPEAVEAAEASEIMMEAISSTISFTMSLPRNCLYWRNRLARVATLP